MPNLTHSGRRLVGALAGMREDDALLIAQQLMLEPHSSAEHIRQCCFAAAEIVARRVDSGVYSLPELTLLGEMIDAIGELVAGGLALGYASRALPPDVTVREGCSDSERFRVGAAELQRIAGHARSDTVVRA